jgi:hypothetical protein
MNRLSLGLALAALLAVSEHALARHVTHRVTPENLDKPFAPFTFTVQVKDAGELKELVITVKAKARTTAPIFSGTGFVTIAPRGQKKAEFPAVTRIQANGVETYSFRLSPADVDRALFTFSETAEDWRTPFPYLGDYWVFHLRDFVTSDAQRGERKQIPKSF